MALPVPHVQMQLGGEWVDISADTLDRDTLAISRGTREGSADHQPTRISLSIRNVDGVYAPRNPSGPHYGLIGHGTPLRVVMGVPPAGGGTSTNIADTDHVAPSVTAASAGRLICAWQTLLDDGDNYSLPAGMSGGHQTIGSEGGGSLMFTAHQAVTAGATGTRTATLADPVEWAALSIWIPGDVTVEGSDAGVAASADASVTTAASASVGWWIVAIRGMREDIYDGLLPPTGGGWQPLVDTATAAATYPRLAAWAKRVTVAGAQTVTAPWVDVPGIDYVGDNHLRVLLLSGVDAWSVRAIGRVASWPTAWTQPNDAWTPIEAYGITRELSRPGPPLRSPLYREATSVRAIGLHAYWPCEDGAEARQLAAIGAGQPMLPEGSVSMASSSAIPGSEPLPAISATGVLRASFLPVAATGVLAYRGVWEMPDTEPDDESRLVDLYAPSGVYRFTVEYLTGGGLRVRAVASDGTQLATSGSLGFAIAGSRMLLGLTLTQDGADIDWQLFAREIAGDGRLLTEGGLDGTFTSLTLGRCTGLVLGGGVNLPGVACGHHMIGDDGALGWNLNDAIVGWIDEPAGRRAERLALEEGVPLTVVGDPDDTTPMGPQRIGSTLQLLRDVADVDGGLLADAAAALEIELRTRASLYNQAPAVELDHDDGEMWGPAAPTDDDTYLVNDVTVRRTGGSSAQVVIADGPRGVDAAGRYAAEVTLNAASDGALPHLASWRTHLGTWDEPRWPTLRINMTALAADPAKADLLDAVAGMALRDLITISNLPVWMPPGTTGVIADGIQERITADTWDIYLQALTPAGPWTVGVLEETTRLSSPDTVLASGIDTDDTTLTVTVNSGPAWIESSTHAAMFPFDARLDAEQVTVTAISGTTWTVTRSVNGAVQSHPAGRPIALWTPWRLAL